MVKNHCSKFRKGKSLFLQTVCMLLVCFGLVLGAPPKVLAKPANAELAPPSSVGAAAVSENKIDLIWVYDGTGGIDGFSIERSQNANSGFVRVADATATALSYTDQGLYPSQTYYYRVKTYKAKGKNVAYSSPSPVAQVTTQSPPRVANPGSFAFDLAAYSVNESAGTVAVTINRVGGADGIATIDWRTTSNTATYGGDYGDFNWTTLTFADGETSKTQNIAIVDDTLSEPDESFDVLLGNPTGGASLDTITTSTVTIKDNDVVAASQPGSFEFAVSGYSVNEGAGTVAVSINRVGGADGIATVDWRTKGNTATYAADYGDFNWTTLTFASGETTKTQNIAIVDDTAVESDESFNVLLGNPTGGAALGNMTTSAVTIKDNDVAAMPIPGSFEFDISAYSVNEGAGKVDITIRRLNGSEGIVTVDWRTKGSTATYAADYGDFDWTTLTFADGETVKTQSVAIVDDTVVESDESFDVLLGNPTGGATLGNLATSTIIIKDNDVSATPQPGSFVFAVSGTSVNEGAGTVAVTINRVGGADGIATVDWRTQSNTATYGADYGDFNWTTLTFADGETTKTQNVAIVEDTDVESDESFDVLLGNPTGGATLGTITASAVTIVDNDTASSDPAPTPDPAPAPAPDPSLGYLPVFPGAKGFGTETKAGRGGAVIKVTNLNDSGSGSLRAALDASGPRIIVFEVSGNIALASNLVVRNPYVTIAGQSAPSPGITLKGAGIEVKTHDVLMQHLRIRVGDGPDGPAPLDRDGCAVYGPGGYNVVIDHVSVSWAVDKGTSAWTDGVKNVTITNSIVSEGLYHSINPQGAHSMGSLVGDYTQNYSFVGNLWAHNWTRNPAMKGDTTTVVLNNVMYDAGPWTFMYMADDFNHGPHATSIVGNVLIEGPSSDTTQGLIVQSNVKSGSKVFLSDNAYTGAGSFFVNQAGSDPRVSSAPVWHPSLIVQKSGNVEASVLANAGCRPADRDAVDNRIVNEVKSRTGNIIDSQSQVGGWPNLAKNTRTFAVPSNPNGDSDGDGYTNIEEVLQQMAAQVEGR
jgi:hypothetical protein